MIWILLSLLIISAFGNEPLDCKVGVETATTTGFLWSYHVIHPDLGPDGADPALPGKVYWVLTLDGVPELSDDDVIAGKSAVGPTCKGQATQVDSEIHEEDMKCTLQAGTVYRFWVVADYDGLGKQAVKQNEAIEPEPDVNCSGHWEECGEDCTERFLIDEWNSGNGATCVFGMFETRACTGGQCPTTGAPLTAAPIQITPAPTPATQAPAVAPVTGAPSTLAPITAMPTTPAPTAGGAFTAAKPTTTGFELTTTFADAPGDGSGMYYWIVLDQAAADPTASNIVSGAAPAICGDSSAITSKSAVTGTKSCTMTPGSQYKVCVALKNTPTATPFKINTCQPLSIPAASPTPHLVVHAPVLTTTPLTFTVDIRNSNPSGMFYYTVTPQNSNYNPQSLTKEQGIRAASAPSNPLRPWATTIPAGCHGRRQQTSSTLMQTIPTATCILTKPGTYQLCGETDTDSNGANAKYVCVPLTVIDSSPDPPVVPAGPTPAGPTQPAKQPAKQPTTSGNGAGYADLLFPGYYCESDEEVEAGENEAAETEMERPEAGEGMAGEVELPEEEEERNAIVGSIIYLAPAATAAICANNVATNRANNLGCSTLFYGGGLLQTCACVRLGYLCDKEESEVYSAIYELTYDPNQDDFAPNTGLLKSGNPLAGKGVLATTFLSIPVVYWIASLCGCLSVFACVCLFSRRKHETGQNYHIRLDAN